MKKTRLLLHIVFLLIFVITYAQNNMERNRANTLSYDYNTLASNKSLQAVGVQSIIQDHEGYVWYGTSNNGICRNNGYQLDVFRNDRSNPSLLGRSNNVEVVAEDLNGNICFGTRDGCHILLKKDYSIFPLDTLIYGKRVNSISISKSGGFWLSANGGIYKYDSNYKLEQSYQIRNAEGEESRFANVYEDLDGNVWAMMTPGGLACMKKGTKSFVPRKWEFKCPPARMTQDRKSGCYWIGLYGDGIARLTNKGIERIEIEKMPESEQRTYTISMKLDEENNRLWVITERNIFGYDIVNGKTLIPSSASIPNANEYKLVNDMLIDNKRQLWVAGANPQIFILNEKETSITQDRLEEIREKASFQIIANNVVYEHGNKWTYNDRIGLVLTDTKNNRTIFGNNLNPNMKSRIIPLSNGTGIWGYSNTMLLHIWYDGNTIQQESISDFEDVDHIQCVAEDNDGNVYIADQKGIILYDTKNGKSKRIHNSDVNLHNIIIGHDGYAYFSTANSGIVRCDKDGNVKNLYSEGNFSVIATTPNNKIWIGNNLGEVYCYDIKTGEIILDEKASNPNSENILSIISDNNSTLCIVSFLFAKIYNTETGHTFLINCDRNNLDMKYFTSGIFDGRDFNLCGSGGIVKFNAGQMFRNGRQTTTPLISSYTIDEVKHYLTSSVHDISVSSDASSLVLYLFCGEFTDAGEMQFCYRMNGGKWQSLSKGDNKLSFLNLHKGDYTIDLMVYDANGVVCQGYSTYIVHKLPAWWETQWAYTLYIMTIIAIMLLILRNQDQKSKMNLRIRNLMDELNGMSITSVPEQIKENNSLEPATEIETVTPETADNEATVKEDAKEEDTPHIRTLSPSDKEFLSQAMTVVTNNISNTEYDVEQFSRDLCMSRASLYRKITALTGQKPTEFIRTIRLKKAADLLRESEYSVSEIVDMVGFSSISYFNKRFKEVFGVQPSQYK